MPELPVHLRYFHSLSSNSRPLRRGVRPWLQVARRRFLLSCYKTGSCSPPAGGARVLPAQSAAGGQGCAATYHMITERGPRTLDVALRCAQVRSRTVCANKTATAALRDAICLSFFVLSLTSKGGSGGTTRFYRVRHGGALCLGSLRISPRTKFGG